MADLSLFLALASVAGMASHTLYFVHGEHHLNAPVILKVYLVAIALPYIAIWLAILKASNVTFAQVILLQITYFSSLFTSIAVYRLFIHRTRKFPGPKLAGLSKFYHCIHATDSRQYRFLHKLYKKYGDFVRTGPNEITVFHADAIIPIHGGNSRCTKSAWYDNIFPIEAVVTTRSRKDHDMRRRIWDQGYSVKALQQHEVTVEKHAHMVKEAIDQRLHIPINVSRWIEYYGFDVMGAVQYSRSFDMVKNGQNHWVLDVFKGGTIILGYMTSVPWLIQICLSTPFLGAEFAKYSAWAKRSILDRINDNPEKRDTISWLIDHARTYTSIEQDWNWLMGDFLTMVTGGTEPVICAIIFLLYHLVAEPKHITTIRKEIDAITSYSATVQLQDLAHLNACIYEALRLHPSIPTGGLRTTPPEGLKIGDTYIPSNTTVLIPQYTLGRREDCFEDAEKFAPERWTTRPEMIRNRVAFMPWGHVMLIDNFDIEFAPGEDGTLLHENTLDCFATIAGPLELIFKHRESNLKAS